MRALALLTCVAAFLFGQATESKRLRPTGSAQLEIRSAGPAVRYGDREWAIDVSHLPINPDQCEETADRQKCATGEPSGCASCVREWHPVAWDERQEVFYLAASTASRGQNRPWVIFSYDLHSNKLTRLASYFGGGFDRSGTVSPDGRYLAYVQYDSQGACGTSSRLAVVDNRNPDSISFRPPPRADDETLLVTAIRWTGQSSLEYDGKISRLSECGADTPARSFTTKIDLSAAGR